MAETMHQVYHMGFFFKIIIPLSVLRIFLVDCLLVGLFGDNDGCYGEKLLV